MNKSLLNSLVSKWSTATLLVFFVTVVTALLLDEAAFANGTGTEIWKDNVGPYAISVGVDPHPPVPGTLRMNVSVTDRESGESVPSASVSVLTISETASASSPTKFGSLPFELPDYHGSVIATHAGEWRLDFNVTSDIGNVEFMVPLTVVDDPDEGQDSFPIIELLAVLGLGAVVVAGLVWLMK